MTECNGCGACCDPVVLSTPPAGLHDGAVDRIYGQAEGRWMREHLRPMRRSDGLKLASYLNGGWTEIRGFRDRATGRAHLFDSPVLLLAHFYSCDRYDAAARRCTDYANRPSMCRGFPWNGDTPDATKALPAECSFRADIGQPVAAPTRRKS